jgi:hypothetical protein
MRICVVYGSKELAALLPGYLDPVPVCISVGPVAAFTLRAFGYLAVKSRPLGSLARLTGETLVWRFARHLGYSNYGGRRPILLCVVAPHGNGLLRWRTES